MPGRTSPGRENCLQLSAAMPASAICASCCEVTPLTDCADHLPAHHNGTPPSRSTALGEMM